MGWRGFLSITAMLALGACERRDRSEDRPSTAEQPADSNGTGSRMATDSGETSAFGAPTDNGAGEAEGAAQTGGSGEGQRETTTAGGTVSGQLTSLREDVLTVQGDRRTYEMRIDENTRTLRNGQPIARDDLKAGANVRTTYRILEGHLVATEIEITGDGQPTVSDAPPAP